MVDGRKGGFKVVYTIIMNLEYLSYIAPDSQNIVLLI